MKKVKNIFLSRSELVRPGLLHWLFTVISEAYKGFNQTSRMELFAKVVNELKPLISKILVV